MGSKPSDRIEELAQASLEEATGSKDYRLSQTHYEKAIIQYLNEQSEKSNAS